jgi:serine/threonine protein kinase
MVGPKDELTDYVATRWYRAPELLVGSRYTQSVDMWAIGCMMAELIDGQPLFPGESDIDQIYCIQKSLGPLIPLHQEILSKSKTFTGLKLPKIQNLESIEKRYSGKIEKIAIDFILALIQLDPEKRLTADQAVQSPYFFDLMTDRRPQTSIIDRGRVSLNSVLVNKGKNNGSPPFALQKIPEKNSESLPPEKRKGKFTKSIKKHLTNHVERAEIKTNVFRTTSNELYRDIAHARDGGIKKKEKKEYLVRRKEHDKLVELREKSKTQFSHISSHLAEFIVKMNEN